MKTQGFTLIELMLSVAVLGIVVAIIGSLLMAPPSSHAGATATAGTATVGATAEDDDSMAERALRAQGFTRIQMGGVPLFGCGDDDSMITSRKFTAINANKMRVSGIACCGLLMKGCTIRF